MKIQNSEFRIQSRKLILRCDFILEFRGKCEFLDVENNLE